MSQRAIAAVIALSCAGLAAQSASAAIVGYTTIEDSTSELAESGQASRERPSRPIVISNLRNSVGGLSTALFVEPALTIGSLNAASQEGANGIEDGEAAVPSVPTPPAAPLILLGLVAFALARGVGGKAGRRHEK